MASIFDGLTSLFANSKGNNSSQKAPASSTDSQNNQKNLWENIGDSVKNGIESVVSGKLFQSSSQPPSQLPSQSQTQPQIGSMVGNKRKAELYSPDNRSEPSKRSRSGQYGATNGKQAAQRAQDQTKIVSEMLKERSQSSFSQGAGGSQGYNNNHSLSPSPVQRVNQTPVASTGSTQGSKPQEKPQVNLRKSRSLPNTSNNSSQQPDNLPSMEECIRRGGAAAKEARHVVRGIQNRRDAQDGYVPSKPFIVRVVNTYEPKKDEAVKEAMLKGIKESNNPAYIETQNVARQIKIDTTRFNREWAKGQKNAQQISESSGFNAPSGRQNPGRPSSFYR